MTDRLDTSVLPKTADDFENDARINRITSRVAILGGSALGLAMYGLNAIGIHIPGEVIAIDFAGSWIVTALCEVSRKQQLGQASKLSQIIDLKWKELLDNPQYEVPDSPEEWLV